VQGDEPLLLAAVIDQVAADTQRYPLAGICTLYDAFNNSRDVLNPNLVKVVMDHEGYALYFSRAAIPWCRDDTDAGTELPPDSPPAYKRHIGIYAYRVAILQQFVGWPVADIEAMEKLEQLRALARGLRIHVARCCESLPPGVDTEAELAHVRKLFQREQGA
ncbi:MAG: 3-deoxy-manno-octulosonate cytidylyltransferase, partial [Pseudomonadales bacterium]|nr:3-deoxy-manno-octulosonate cytidylyltransferase [Pseudomonadales bacterium]